MNKEFDNFKLFNKLLKQRRKCLDENEKLTDYKHYYYIVQDFYILYFHEFGYNFIKDKVENSFLRELFPKLIDDCVDYEQELLDETEDLLNQLSYQKFFPTLKPYLPMCDMAEIVQYAKANHDKANYNLELSLLITIFLIPNADFSVKETITRYHYLASLFYNAQIFDFYKTSNLVSRFFETIEREEFNLFPKEFPADGEFLLPCYYVTFFDGFIDVKHPDSRVVERIPYEKSKAAYENISSYMKKKLPYLLVEAKHNRIVKILNLEIIENILEVLDKKTLSPDFSLTAKKRQRYARMTQAEICREIKHMKSQYLNYLIDRQLNDYKLCYCLERRCHHNEDEVLEDTFIFTIKKRVLVVAIMENVDIGRSSIIFYIEPEQYETAIRKIHEFFASDVINKRQLIANNQLKLKASGIFSISRIIHTDFQSWKRQINEL